MKMNNVKCILVLDVDGTIVPVSIDFDKLRSEVRRTLGINHSLKPLGESLSNLNIKEDLKLKAWELIERAELESIDKIELEEVKENVDLLETIPQTGIELLLVTMRSMKSIKPLLLKIGLDEFINRVITRDHYPSREQQLKHIKETYKDLNIVFIGDTDYDEESSLRAGVDFIRVRKYNELPTALSKAINKCFSTRATSP